MRRYLLLFLPVLALSLVFIQVSSPKASAVELPVCNDNTPIAGDLPASERVALCEDHGGYTTGRTAQFCNDRQTRIQLGQGGNADDFCSEHGGYTQTGRAGSCGAGSFLGLPTWYRYLDVAVIDGKCDVVGPSRTVNGTQELDWPRVVGFVAIALVEILLRIASLVAVGFVIYGGFNFITSQGEPEKAKSARQTVQNALIGLVIAIAAASIVAFVGNRLGD